MAWPWPRKRGIDRRRLRCGDRPGFTSPVTVVDPVVAARQSGERARSALAGSRFSDVRWVAETGSTNADVLSAARDGDGEGVVVVADHQTAGRGRLGRTWEAPNGAGLLCTVLLRPRAAVAGASTMLVAVAAAEAVEELTGASPRLKWPNDLVWPGDGSGPDRKLAGILAEAEWPAASHIASGWSPPEPNDRATVAVGIGINVAWGSAVPPELAETAVSLDELTAPSPPPDRVDLLVRFLRRLEVHHAALRSSGDRSEVQALWRARSATLGRQVRVDLGADDVVGTAVDITDEGHLVVETLEGDRRTLAVGDVVHLRPA
jgi:BirA family biotin operon repressor/biotin-[acetyl-CoA-carboxylase] ligase